MLLAQYEEQAIDGRAPEWLSNLSIMDPRAVVPSWVRAIRQSLALSQYRLAPLIYRTRATIALWESGTFTPDYPATASLLLMEMVAVAQGTMALEHSLIWRLLHVSGVFTPEDRKELLRAYGRVNIGDIARTS